MNRHVRTTLAASTLAALALGLTACGGGSDDGTATPQETVTVTESPEPSTDTSAATGDRGDNRTGGNSSGGGNASSGGNASGNALAAAARTAASAVDGRVVNVDQEPSGWEVDLVAPDGSETRVDVSADGSRVLGQQPDDDDAEDRAENQQLLGARVDWATALEDGQQQLQGDVDEIDLSEDDGRIVWEISLPGDGPGTSIILDADSGQVLGSDDD